MESPKINMAAYVRSALDPSRGGDEALAAQTRKILEHAASIGLKVVKLIEEPNDSGISFERPGLAELVEILQGGEVDGLIVADLGRLAREQGDFWALYRKLFAAGGPRLVSVAEGIDTEAHPLWVRKILQGFASVGLAELKDEAIPQGCESRAIRRMQFLGLERVESFCPHDDSVEETIVLQLDNGGGRPDDLQLVGISVPEGVELREQLEEVLGEHDDFGDEGKRTGEDN